MTVLFIIFLCALALSMQMYDSKLKHDRWLAQRQDPKSGLQGNARFPAESFADRLPE